MGVFGDTVTAHVIFPFVELARYIELTSFLERMEILVIVFLDFAVIIKLALLFHCTGIVAASTLSMKDYRITLIPIALITIILSRVQFGTYLKLSNFLFYILPITILILNLAIPALVLLIAVIRKKGGKAGAPVANK